MHVHGGQRAGLRGPCLQVLLTCGPAHGAPQLHKDSGGGAGAGRHGRWRALRGLHGSQGARRQQGVHGAVHRAVGEDGRGGGLAEGPRGAAEGGQGLEGPGRLPRLPPSECPPAPEGHRG